MITKYLYVLRCEKSKYYVGVANNVVSRFQQHKTGSGSAFTKIYKPIDIVKVVELKSAFDEDVMVKEYMKTFGIQNVRGGTWSQLTFKVSQYEFLQKELNHSQGNCLQCGSSDHFVKNCNGNGNSKNKIQMYLQDKISYEQVKSSIKSLDIVNYILTLPETSQTCNLIGNIYKDFGHDETCKTCKTWYQKAMKLDPNNPNPVWNLYLLVKKKHMVLGGYELSLLAKSIDLGSVQGIDYFKTAFNSTTDICGPWCKGSFHSFNIVTREVTICHPSEMVDSYIHVPLLYPFKKKLWERIGYFD